MINTIEVEMRQKETRPRLVYTRDMLEPVIRSSTNFCEVARKLGYPEYSVRGYSNKLAKKAKLFGIDCTHFKQAVRGAALGKTDDEIFHKDTDFHNRVTRNRLIKMRGNRCEHCGISEWLGEILIPDVHHLNKNRRDNRLENLKVVCPNCHRLFHKQKFKKKCK